MATAGNSTRRPFQIKRFETLTLQSQELLLAAQQALEGRSYSPYSGFIVAAAVRVRGGQIVTGTNVENAAFGSSICAERSALTTVHNQGVGDQCVAIAVVARAKEGPTTRVTAPCGECRQVIAEYAYRSGTRERFCVLLATTALDKVVVTTLGLLLPLAFTPEDLLVDDEE